MLFRSLRPNRPESAPLTKLERGVADGMKTVLVIAAAAANCALAVTLRGTGSGSNANNLVAWGSGSDSEQLEADGSLRPEVVAQLLGQVGMSWVHDRYEAMEHTISDTLALAHITESCSKVASAVVSASDCGHSSWQCSSLPGHDGEGLVGGGGGVASDAVQ